MIKDFAVDIQVYCSLFQKNWLSLLLTKQSLWAIAQYRLNHWLEYKYALPLVRQALKIIVIIWKKLIEITFGIELPQTAQIGKGLFLPHPYGIVLHPDVKIGEYCTISHEVTIGLAGRGKKQGVPHIGDRVYIAPGAKIFGKIKIGNDVAIGANAVVTKDLPDNAVAVGIPAKVISYEGSRDFLHYLD